MTMEPCPPDGSFEPLPLPLQCSIEPQRPAHHGVTERSLCANFVRRCLYLTNELVTPSVVHRDRLLSSLRAAEL